MQRLSCFVKRRQGKHTRWCTVSVTNVFVIGNYVGITCSPVKKKTALKAARESNLTTANTSVIFNLSSTKVVSCCFPSYSTHAAKQQKQMNNLCSCLQRLLLLNKKTGQPRQIFSNYQEISWPCIELHIAIWLHCEVNYNAEKKISQLIMIGSVIIVCNHNLS